MTEERINVVPGSNFTPLIAEGNSILDQQDTSSASLHPAAQSTLAILDNAQAKHARSYSTGNIVLPYAREKVFSRYFSPSSSSCHDYCKYGIKHALETETKTRSCILKSPTISKSKGLDIDKVLTLAETKKKLIVSSTPNPGSESHKPDIPVSIKSKVLLSTKKQNVLPNQLSLPIKRINISAGHANDSVVHIPSRPSSLLMKECLRNKEEGEAHEKREIGPSLLKPLGDISWGEKDEIKGKKELSTTSLGKQKVLLGATASLTARHSIKRVLMQSLSSTSSAKKIFSTGKDNNLKGLSHVEDQRNIECADSKQTGIKDVTEKTIHVIESNKAKTMEPTEVENHSMALPPSLSSKSDGENLKQAQSATHRPRLSPTSAKKFLRRVAGRVYAAQTPLSSGSKSLRQTKGVPRSSKSLTAPSSFKSTNSSTSSESYETEGGAVNTKVELKNEARKNGVIITKDKCSPARKLNFRQGRVVELLPDISNPTQLKFRQRVPADHQVGNNDTMKCNLEKTELDGGQLDAGKGESEKFVLKHQDVQEKKVVQILFNNVIEETASKLAETRKSKVKALVGAFETVISLQDSKPVSVVDAC
uniref:Uncharacterized protein MANES_06G088100 n=1 Tax=Rhizophora mucronata TaxID=61149 RepID=A0A2P2QPB6_RHIMU